MAIDLWLKELAGDCISEATLGTGGLGEPGQTDSAPTGESAYVVTRWHEDGDHSVGTKVWLSVDDALTSGQCVEIEAERIATEIAREHLSDGHRS